MTVDSRIEEIRQALNVLSASSTLPMNILDRHIESSAAALVAVEAELGRVGVLEEALLAVRDYRCNGCGLPAKEWGPVCCGVSQGDFTHFHSPEFWISRALAAASEPEGRKIDRIPSHRSDELPCYIQINRANFAVDSFTLTGAQIRRLPTPVISDDYDLWKAVPGDNDVLVPDDDKLWDLHGGRFFSVPKIINAGAAASEEATT